MLRGTPGWPLISPELLQTDHHLMRRRPADPEEALHVRSAGGRPITSV
jgi:hypothetical protein